jgi:type I site-specific restriction-modification system R (restriction) subunit
MQLTSDLQELRLKEQISTLRKVFGNYVDIYDIAKSVEDGSTVRIYYESRLAKVNLDEEGRRLIEEFDKELEQDEEVTEKEKAKAKWSKLEAIVGNNHRLKILQRILSIILSRDKKYLTAKQ